MSEAYAKLLSISNICAFLFHMGKVYTYMLIGSISEVYTYVLFDVVSVDVYLCNFYFVCPCSNMIRLDVFRIIRFENKVNNM